MISSITKMSLFIRRKIGFSKHVIISVFCIGLLIGVIIVSLAIFSPVSKQTSEVTTAKQSEENNIQLNDSNPPEMGKPKQDEQKHGNSDTANITVEKIKGGFGASVTIKNNGNAAVNDIDWSIQITKGTRSKMIKETVGTIPTLVAGEQITEKTGVFLGLGRINITITVNGVEKSVKGIQLFLFTRIR